MTYLNRRHCLGVALVIVVIDSSAKLPGQQPNTVARVTQAWREREEKIKTLRCEWAAIDTIPKGSLAIGNPGAPSDTPPHDALIEAKATLMIGLDRLRYSYNGQDWSSEAGALIPRSYTTAFDGKTERSFFEKSPDHESAQGVISQSKKPEEATSLIVSPVTLFCRGCNPLFRAFDLESYEPTGREVKFQDRACVELKLESRAAQRVDSLLLDQARGYLLLRRVTTVGGATTLQVTIDYATDPVVGWVPKSWEYAARLPDGRLLRAVRSSATQMEVNPQISDDVFVLSFPPGTRVGDQSSGTEVQFVVLPNGQSGKSIPSSAAPTYEQLQNAGAAGRWNWAWVVVPSGVLLIAAIGWLVCLRQRRRTVRRPVTGD